MLSFVLVSLLVSSALAVPVSVTQYSINEIPPVRDNGRLISSYLTSGALESVDGGDTNIYILTIQQILNDLANKPDGLSQALALGQTLAILGELATGIPGDSCEAAALIDAYANGIRTGNLAGVRSPLKRYLRRLASIIDLIVKLVRNPDAVRYSTGLTSNCAGGGRTYQFEAAWDAVLDRASPYQIGLINEEYCAAKRLYSAFNIRSNNVGAAVTATALSPVTQVVEQARTQIAGFLRAVISGSNLDQAAANAKQALLSAPIQL